MLPLELELDHYGGDVSLGVLAEAYKLPVSVVHLREEKREAKLVRISQLGKASSLFMPAVKSGKLLGGSLIPRRWRQMKV